MVNLNSNFIEIMFTYIQMISLPGSVGASCGSGQMGGKEDNLAEDCEEFVEELVAVVVDTFAAQSWRCWCQLRRPGARSGRPGWSGAVTMVVLRKEGRGRFEEQGAGSETSVLPGEWPRLTGQS